MPCTLHHLWESTVYLHDLAVVGPDKAHQGHAIALRGIVSYQEVLMNTVCATSNVHSISEAAAASAAAKKSMHWRTAHA